jgi:hypothetical protein
MARRILGLGDAQDRLRRTRGIAGLMAGAADRAFRRTPAVSA